MPWIYLLGNYCSKSLATDFAVEVIEERLINKKN